MNAKIIPNRNKPNVAKYIAVGVVIGLATLLAVSCLDSVDQFSAGGTRVDAPPKIDLTDIGAPKPEKVQSLPTASSQAARPVTSSTALGVGSEGYAPKILHAIGAGTAADAVAAATLIAVCRDVDRSVETLYRLKAENKIKKIDIGYVKAIEVSQAEQRACQTVTPDLLALRPQLLLKAIEGKQFGAAATYVSEVQATTGIEAKSKGTVAAALRADAEQGDKHAVGFLAFMAIELGVSEVDRRTYLLANKVIIGNGNNLAESYFTELFETHFKAQPALSDAQHAEVESKSQALVEAYKRRQLRNP